jgi:hypothetical protein
MQMKDSMYAWISRSSNKYILGTSAIALLLWSAAYAALHSTNSYLCITGERGCLDFWMHTFAGPFYFGHLLKSIIIAPLFVLFSTRMAFKVWAVMSLIVIPFWLYVILIYAPIYGDYVNKDSMSNAGGIVYFTLTLAIALGVPLIEYIVRRVRGV